MNNVLVILRYLIVFVFLTSLITIGVISYFLFQLPDETSLEKYKPNVMTRVHASNGDLVKEYSREYRIFIPIEDIPSNVKFAFISAEDKNFYNHFGIDPLGIVRASIKNISNFLSNRRPEGASTITQQVAKNFLLTDELTLSRKIKEALLAIKIERTLSKERILELYLNQIYLGAGSYGIGAASNRYFKKSLNELSIPEVSFLASLPKAPSRYNPEKNYNLALARRNWVLERMFVNEYIDEIELMKYQSTPIETSLNQNNLKFESDYYLEEIRKQILSIYGEDYLYNGGLSVRSSLNTSTQIIADNALKSGLLAYDKRHGYRGALNNNTDPKWYKNYINHKNYKHFKVARVTQIDENDNKAKLEVLINKKLVTGYLNDFKWARKSLGKGYLGPVIEKINEVLKVNDIILVSNQGENNFSLEQIPKINGGIVVMDPHTGRVFALSGGFDFNRSNFNRVYQAMRQPGSSIKPFIYMSALENGLQPNSLILDAPFVIDQGGKLGKWKPENYGKKFYGPTTLRKGIENSRNLMTVRIAQYLGMDKISEIAQRAGIMENMPPVLSMALGAGETSLIKLTTAYASFINGGKKVKASLIDRIQDRRGKNIYLEDFSICENCSDPYIDSVPLPILIDNTKKIFNETKSYQMVSILKGAVDRGTGRKTKINGIEIAGKTGTTNNNTDAWFIGFTSDIIVGVYAGFDIPETLGKKETGSSVAVPIFKKFIEEYYENNSVLPFTIPKGIELIKIDHETGKITQNQDKSKTIYEAFSKSDNLAINNKTLIGEEGFQIIQIQDEDNDEFVIY